MFKPAAKVPIPNVKRRPSDSPMPGMLGAVVESGGIALRTETEIDDRVILSL